MFSRINKYFLSVLTVIAFVIGSLFLSVEVSALGSIDMYAGQEVRFTITYSNGGDVPEMENAQLRIFIGSELEVDTASFTDSWNGGTEYPVVSTVATQNSGIWGWEIAYQPLSANTVGTPSGTSSPGNITLPLNEEGEFSFNATLKSDILDRYDIGDVLRPIPNNQGISSVLQHDGPGLTDTFDIRIVQDDCSVANQEATTGGGFNQTSGLLDYSSMIFNPNPGVVEESMTITVSGLAADENGNCSTGVLTGTECTITLQGDNGNYNQSFTGTVINGQCAVTIPANQAPTEPGDYEAVAQAEGPDGTLYTDPNDIEFIEEPIVCTPEPTTGGGFDGNQNLLEFGSLTFNPNPGVVEGSITITATGLVADPGGTGCSPLPIDGEECTITLQGDNGNYNQSFTGTVTNGQCAVTIPANQAPTEPGDYEAVVEVEDYQTEPQEIEFVDGVIVINTSETMESGLTDCSTSVTSFISPSVRVGEDYTCYFDVVTGYELPDTGTFSASTANGTKVECESFTSASTTLVCSDIPAGTTVGTFDVNLHYASGTDSEVSADKGNVIVQAALALPRSGGLAVALVATVGAALAGLYSYIRTRRRKLKINTTNSKK